MSLSFAKKSKSAMYSLRREICESDKILCDSSPSAIGYAPMRQQIAQVL